MSILFYFYIGYAIGTSFLFSKKYMPKNFLASIVWGILWPTRLITYFTEISYRLVGMKQMTYIAVLCEKNDSDT